MTHSLISELINHTPGSCQGCHFKNPRRDKQSHTSITKIIQQCLSNSNSYLSANSCILKHCILITSVQFVLLSVCLSVGLRKIYWPNFHVTWLKGLEWSKEEPIIFLSGSGSRGRIHKIFFTLIKLVILYIQSFSQVWLHTAFNMEVAELKWQQC